MPAGERWSVVERQAPVDTRQRLAGDIRTGLAQSPPWVPARWFYDEKGSLLFEDITTLPEYYPARREREILAARSAEVAALTRATTLVELGSGTSTKTRLLLDALTVGGRPLRFVPLDVSAEVLSDAARTIAGDYPSVTVEGLVADFVDPLGPLPGTAGERLVLFLGGTIGNLNPAGRSEFLDRLRAALAPGDHFLLGADLVKDPGRLIAAYDDSTGTTAAFNLNLIEVLRRELDAEGLSTDDFEHVARWNAERSHIEMWLRATRDVHAYFPDIDLTWDLPAGGELLTEISTKFTLAELNDQLTQHQFTPVRSWTDAAADFSLTLTRAR